MAPIILEDLDIAEVLVERHKATPIWNDLMDEYDADTVDDLGTGWPPILATTFDQPANGDNPGDGPTEAEPAAPNPPVTEPAPEEPTPASEPDAPADNPEPAPETAE